MEPKLRIKDAADRGVDLKHADILHCAAYKNFGHLVPFAKFDEISYYYTF